MLNKLPSVIGSLVSNNKGEDRVPTAPTAGMAFKVCDKSIFDGLPLSVTSGLVPDIDCVVIADIVDRNESLGTSFCELFDVRSCLSINGIVPVAIGLNNIRC